MAEQIPLPDQNAAPSENAPIETEGTDELTEADDVLEEELEELVIEDFTIDGICGVY